MPGRAPRAAKNAAVHAASGVFPAPPTARFPIATAGNGSRRRRNQPFSYALARALITVRYAKANGSKTPRATRAGAAPLHQSHCAIPCAFMRSP